MTNLYLLNYYQKSKPELTFRTAYQANSGILGCETAHRRAGAGYVATFLAKKPVSFWQLANQTCEVTFHWQTRVRLNEGLIFRHSLAWLVSKFPPCAQCYLCSPQVLGNENQERTRTTGRGSDLDRNASFLETPTALRQLSRMPAPSNILTSQIARDN